MNQRRPALMLDRFLRPAKVALIGASRNPASVTARPAAFLRDYGYSGEAVVVNPQAVPQLHGHPAVATIADAATDCDVALIMVPAEDVLANLEECAAAGINGAVVIASGFEGDRGAARRAELDAFLARNPQMRLIGPNCNGVMNAIDGAFLCFSSVLLEQRPQPGRVGLVTQSGAIGNGLLLALIRRGVGLSYWVSTGDEVSAGALEIAAEMLDEPHCDAVGLFLEGITDPQFLEPLAEAIARTGKRVLCLRSAASALGRAAAFGHTGRVVGSDEIARAALEQAGVRLVPTLDALCDALTVLSVLPARSPDARARVGIVTVSGGTGVIAADAVAASPALDLARFDGAAHDEIIARIGERFHVANPLDVPVLDDSSAIHGAIGAVAAAGGCDAVVAVVTSIAHDYDYLSTAGYPTDVPLVLTHLSPGEQFTQEQAERLAAVGVATVPTPVGAVEALAVWAGATGETPMAAPERDAGECGAGSQLGILGSAQLLGPAFAQRLADTRKVTSATEAAAVARELGGAVVVKADGAAIAHRTELGAVRVGLRGDNEVTQAYEDIASIARAAGDEVVVQAMAPRGVEVLGSAVRDAEVGVAVVCRLGGLLVEVGGPSVVLTGDRHRWRQLLEVSALGPVLTGWRGAPAADIAGLTAFLVDLAEALDAHPDVRGVECNPLLVHQDGQGVSVVDVVTAIRTSAG